MSSEKKRPSGESWSRRCLGRVRKEEQEVAMIRETTNRLGSWTRGRCSHLPSAISHRAPYSFLMVTLTPPLWSHSHSVQSVHAPRCFPCLPSGPQLFLKHSTLFTRLCVFCTVSVLAKRS